MSNKGMGYFVDRGVQGFRGFIKPSKEHPIQTLHKNDQCIPFAQTQNARVCSCQHQSSNMIKTQWEAALAEGEKNPNVGPIQDTWLKQQGCHWTFAEAYDAV